MRGLVKNNIALITGIALPLVLFMCLVLFLNFRKYLTPPPKYDFIYTFNNHQVSVKNNKIIYDYSKILPPAYLTTYPLIYVFHVKTNHTEAIVDLSNLAKMQNNSSVIDVFTFPSNATISQNTTAPDGYRWQVKHEVELGPILLYGLEKNGKFVATGRSSSNLKPTFLGWIIPHG